MAGGKPLPGALYPSRLGSSFRPYPLLVSPPSTIPSRAGRKTDINFGGESLSALPPGGLPHLGKRRVSPLHLSIIWGLERKLFWAKITLDSVFYRGSNLGPVPVIGPEVASAVPREGSKA